MKKGILALGLVMSIIFGGIITARADSYVPPTATFDGRTDISYNYDADDFGSGFYDMLPGEEREQTICLENITDRDVDFFMSASVIQSFEDIREASGGAYHIRLVSVQNGREKVIYGNEEGTDANVGGVDKEGLKDLNGIVNEWFLAASLPGQGKADIRLEVSLEGESHNNTYQDAAGRFQFMFRAGYEEDQIVQVQKKGTDKIITLLRTVKTGDDSSAEIFLSALILSAGVAGVIFLRRGKRNLPDAKR